MNLRSFLPPPPPATGVARPPAVGEPAPPLPVSLGGRPAVISFLRHTGCPFAEATLRELRERAAAQDEVEWIAISHAPELDTAAWSDRIGGAGPVLLCCDPDRSSYAAWGLGRTGARHFIGGRSLRAAIGLARRGIRNTHPEGSRWQQAGSFAVGSAGLVVWRHLPAHAGDLPDLEAAAQAARAASR